MNTFTSAARELLLNLPKSAKKDDAEIARLRGKGLGDKCMEISGRFSTEAEDVADISHPEVFTLDQLGLRIDTRGYEYVTKHCARSCQPNLKLHPLINSKERIVVVLRPTMNIAARTTCSIPFNKGWAHSSNPLNCIQHPFGDCPFEKERQENVGQKPSKSGTNYQGSPSFRELVEDKYENLPIEDREAPRGNTALIRVSGAIQIKSHVDVGEIAFQLFGSFHLASEKQGDRAIGGSEKVFLSYQLTQPVCVVVRDASKFLRRSCKANSEVKLVRGTNGMRMLVVATRKMDKGTEVKIPFDKDWKESKKELKCVDHERDMSKCPMEKTRRKQHEKATAK